jgi:hypothetical protein
MSTKPIRVIFLSIGFSLFNEVIIGSKKTETNQKEQESFDDKAEIGIKKPAQHQRCNDKQSVVQYA